MYMYMYIYIYIYIYIYTHVYISSRDPTAAPSRFGNPVPLNRNSRSLHRSLSALHNTRYIFARYFAPAHRLFTTLSIAVLYTRLHPLHSA